MFQSSRSGWRCRQCLVLVLALLVAGLPNVAPAADERADEIIAALKQWRDRFTTMELEYDIASRDALEARFPELKQVPDLLDDWGSRHLFQWAAFGAVSEDTTKRERGEQLSRYLSGVTPVVTYSAEGRPGERGATQWERISTQVRYSHHNLSTTPQLPLLALWPPGEGRWIDEVLATAGPELTWTGPADWNGKTYETCELEFPADISRWSGQLWFDREHGWLPARATPLRGGPGLELEVREFREVRPGWWFPFQGEAGSREGDGNWYQWRMRRIEPNLPLSLESFVPPAPTMGTWVTEPGKRPRVHGRAEPDSVASPSRSLADSLPRGLRELPVRAWAPWLFVIGLVLIGLRAWRSGRRA